MYRVLHSVFIRTGTLSLPEGLAFARWARRAIQTEHTRFMVGSNTKALVTLLLARLVDEKRITWDTPVVAVFPSFKLGDAATTRQVEIKHLICACTGMPRQDFELRFRSGQLTPDKVMALLGTMQPTSGFGELFQYSNPMAAAAGYIAGHILYPHMELGAAFDRAMQVYVFDPLGMHETTMDFALAQRGNFAASHGLDVDGHVIVTRARPDFIVPQRPAGAVWSSVNDMLKYVAMELAGGRLPDGRRFIDEDVLLAASRGADRGLNGRYLWHGAVSRSPIRHSGHPSWRRHHGVL